MKVLCINNTGEFLRLYEYNSISRKEEFGRFGVSEYGHYAIEPSKEYLVMGIIIFKTYQAYLVDDKGFISACPCHLFKVVENSIISDWRFRLISKEENIYPHVQAIIGYPELCLDKKAFQKLIVDKDKNAERIYYRRKIDLEKQLFQ